MNLQETIDMLEHEGIYDNEVQALLYYTCQSAYKRILSHMNRLGIHKTGQLKRSIHWTIWQSTNGDEHIIRFFYETYGKFVELSVQKGFKVTDYGVDGKLPGQVTGSYFPSVTVDRKNKEGAVLRRKAKPFIAGAARAHFKTLSRALINHYGFLVGGFIKYGWLPPAAFDPHSDAVINCNTTFLEADDDLMKAFGYKGWKSR